MSTQTYKTWKIIDGDYQRSEKDDYEEQMKGFMRREKTSVKIMTLFSMGLSVAVLLILLHVVSGGN